MCDTLVSLTADGVLFAKNSDRDVNEPQMLRWLPAADHPEGADVAVTWTRIPQVRRTHAVLISKPWWMWGAEMGANEHGVVIGNEAVFTRRTGGQEGSLLGMDLLRLGLERATSAAAAVEVIVGLLETYGQGGSCSDQHPGFRYDNSYLVSDRDGAIVLETAGRQWATEHVIGRGRSISNGLTIPGFAEAHADRLRGRVAACRSRRALTEPAATRATGPLDLFAALREHGGSGASWSALNGTLGAPCVHGGGIVTGSQSTASWVADLRDGGRHWVTGTSAPCLSLFKPVTVADPAPVDPPTDPNGRFDPAYRWWRHEQLHRRALLDHPAALARIAPEQRQLEEAWVAEPPATEAAFAEADAVEERWLAGLPDLQDLRPWWVRRQWERFDRKSGMQVEAGVAARAWSSGGGSR